MEKEAFQVVTEGLEIPLSREEIQEKVQVRLTEDVSDIMHNVSGCHLPAARRIMQRRYQ